MRLTYRRGEPVKYVSHLDFVKVFERALRRASIEVAFSQGFNPRMLLVFGNPLPVGYTSDFELLDITFARPYEKDFIIENLNRHLPGEIFVMSAEELTKPYPSILSTVGFAEYEGKISGIADGDADALNAAFKSNFVIPAMKRTKSGEKEIDIKPMIKSFEVTHDILKVTTVTGQEGNLRPELALSGVSKLCGIDCELSEIRKVRMF